MRLSVKPKLRIPFLDRKRMRSAAISLPAKAVTSPRGDVRGIARASSPAPGSVPEGNKNRVLVSQESPWPLCLPLCGQSSLAVCTVASPSAVSLRAMPCPVVCHTRTGLTVVYPSCYVPRRDCDQGELGTLPRCPGLTLGSMVINRPVHVGAQQSTWTLLVVMEILRACAVLYDIILKNFKKLENPRGEPKGTIYWKLLSSCVCPQDSQLPRSTLCLWQQWHEGPFSPDLKSGEHPTPSSPLSSVPRVSVQASSDLLVGPSLLCRTRRLRSTSSQ
ncbi:hypothetical protein CB1_000632074 [Camelus ferus]|nr:hypothetical protein CB1_000632074 [Camelus ferus]